MDFCNNKQKKETSVQLLKGKRNDSGTSFPHPSDRAKRHLRLTTGCLECPAAPDDSSTPGKAAPLLTCCSTEETLQQPAGHPLAQLHTELRLQHASGTIYSCNPLTKAFRIFFLFDTPFHKFSCIPTHCLLQQQRMKERDGEGITEMLYRGKANRIYDEKNDTPK